MLKELLALRKQVHSFEVKLADLEKLRKAERYIYETLRDVLEISLSSAAAMEKEGLRKVIYLTKKETVS